MSAPSPLSANERLFEPFFDAIDATVLISSTQPLHQIASLTPNARLRFPLQLDQNASLFDHLRASDHAPSSGRFGAFCDNVLGMNWLLTDGRRVRIGERVVKSTTGYDWFRFLLHTDGRFGHPTDYVIRLRPDCGLWLSASFAGTPACLRNLIKLLLTSGWMHWWDSVDLLADASTQTCRVTVNCPETEASLFEGELARVATCSGTSLALSHESGPPLDGLPDLSVKTTPDRAATLAHQLVGLGMRTVTMSYCGVIHAYTPAPDAVPALLAPLEKELHAEGGHWMSRHHPANTCSPLEEPWLKSLRQSLAL